MHKVFDLIVIGSGIAGLSAAKAFKEQAPDKTVLIINGEDRLPYKRTKISKFISKGFGKEDFSIFDQYKDYGLIIQERVTSVDFEKIILILSNSASYSWKILIIATGAKAVKIYHQNSLTIRCAKDTENLIRFFSEAKTAAIVGGGVLSIEAAEQLQEKGLEVSLISRNKCLMEKLFCERLSKHVEEVLSHKNINMFFNSKIQNIDHKSDGFHIKSNDEIKKFDIFIECLGSVPDLDIFQNSVLELDSGIRVNSFLQSNISTVFAAGDCAQMEATRPGYLWHQAQDQGEQAGKNAALMLQNRELEVYADTPRRMKLEVFGQYYFTQNYDSKQAYDNVYQFENKGCYQEFYYKSGVLKAINMMGDKERAKQYEQALWENWPIYKVSKELLMG